MSLMLYLVDFTHDFIISNKIELVIKMLKKCAINIVLHTYKIIQHYVLCLSFLYHLIIYYPILDTQIFVKKMFYKIFFSSYFLQELFFIQIFLITLQ